MRQYKHCRIQVDRPLDNRTKIQFTVVDLTRRENNGIHYSALIIQEYCDDTFMLEIGEISQQIFSSLFAGGDACCCTACIFFPLPPREKLAAEFNQQCCLRAAFFDFTQGIQRRIQYLSKTAEGIN